MHPISKPIADVLNPNIPALISRPAPSTARPSVAIVRIMNPTAMIIAVIPAFTQYFFKHSLIHDHITIPPKTARQFTMQTLSEILDTGKPPRVAER
jgi:hypothetical protein